MENDIVYKDYYCPRCQSKLIEKRPKEDKHIFKFKNNVVRLQCVCGYYRDEILPDNQFKDNS